MGQGYVNFTRNCMDQIRGKVTDELWILNFFEQWYTCQINILCNWLSERLDHSLHPYQCTCLAVIVKVIFIAYFSYKGLVRVKGDDFKKLKYKISGFISKTFFSCRSQNSVIYQ